MLAPQTIRVRYGNSGLIGAAVAAAAASDNSNRNFEQQANRDQSFVNQMLDYKNQQQSRVDNMNANMLQQAYAQHGPQVAAAPQSTIDPQSDAMLKSAYLAGAIPDLGDETDRYKGLVGNRNVSPNEMKDVITTGVGNAQRTKKEQDAEAAKTQKQAYLKSAVAGLDPDDAEALTAASESPDVSLPQLRLAIANAQKGHQQRVGVDKETANKKAFAQQVAANLQGPGHAEALAAMAEDPKTSMNQVRAAYSELLGREHTNKQQGKVFQAQGLDHEAQAIATSMARIGQEMAKVGIDPEAAKPSDFNPTFADPNRARWNTMSAADAVQDSPAGIPGQGAGSLVTPNSKAQFLQQYMAYHTLKQHLQKLLTARQALAGDAGYGDDTPGTAAGSVSAQAPDPLGIR